MTWKIRRGATPPKRWVRVVSPENAFHGRVGRIFGCPLRGKIRVLMICGRQVWFDLEELHSIESPCLEVKEVAA